MFKIIFLAVFVCLNAQAERGPDVLRINGLNWKAGVNLLRHYLDEAKYLHRNSSFSLESSSNYSSGDFVILWGVGPDQKDQSITEEEYKGLWRVINYLSRKDFRVIMNVRSTSDDLKDALGSPSSSVVVWSAHGNQSYFYDFNHAPVPTNIFDFRAPNVYQFILSTCHGAQALRANYVIPGDLKIYAWESTTNARELINFLVGDGWSGFEGKKTKIKRGP